MSEKPGTFQKGDKRINRNGRPRVFDELSNMTREMFTRPALDSAGNPVEIEGRPATIVEVVVWKMIHSKDPREVQRALEIAYGKVPDRTELTGADGGAVQTKSIVEIRGVDYRTIAAKLAPGSVPDSDAPGESKNPVDG